MTHTHHRSRGAARTLTALAVALALVATLPPVHADLVLHSDSILRNDVAATHAAGTTTFEAVFHVTQATGAYLKVSPRPGNPVFDNGTAGKSGWWTEVELTNNATTHLAAAVTTGDPPIELGQLVPGATYTLRLTVHAPSGALARETFHVLDFILAQHDEGTAGSGGTFDQSIPLHAIWHVQGDAGAKPGLPGILWFLSLLVLLIAIVATYLALRKRRGDPGAPPKPPTAGH